MVAYSSLVLLGASAAVANPLFPRQQSGPTTVTVTAQAPASTAWNAGAVTEYPIHASADMRATTSCAGETLPASTRSTLEMLPPASL
jgi:hypothetical protein